LRAYAPRSDGEIDEPLIRKILLQCYQEGARSLTLSSSGEPTLSPVAVTKALTMVDECRSQGCCYDPVRLYTNGIRIGEDLEFCRAYLPLWKSMGLKELNVTVHDVDESKNAEVYRVPTYPSLDSIVERVHAAQLQLRANIVLSRETIGTYDQFVTTVTQLKQRGFDAVAAWPLRNNDDVVDPVLAPPPAVLDAMYRWVQTQDPAARIKLLCEHDHAAYAAGEKVTLFPDGKLSNTWCR